ncbi:MAG: hypothetical protein ACSLEN_10380 [Candidatus Malihini olakiniferum]
MPAGSVLGGRLAKQIQHDIGDTTGMPFVYYSSYIAMTHRCVYLCVLTQAAIDRPHLEKHLQCQ